MIIRTRLKSWLFFFALIVGATVITSCTSLRNGEWSKKSQGGGFIGGISLPRAHVWQYIYSFGDENRGYSSYSYVLVGRDENNQVSSSLYFELIKAIQGSTVSIGILTESVLKENFNLFLIPAISSEDSESHKPNYELSKLLLTALSTTSPLTFSQPGPYIITLYQPISFGKPTDEAEVMYTDLTGIHTDVIPELVKAYKSQVLNTKISGVDKLQSFRLSLLNLALITEDSIGFAKVAYAELQKAFFE